MGGFQNQSLNVDFRKGFFDIIIRFLIRSCEKMIEECSSTGNQLQNHEEKIRTYLLEHYLENDDVRKELGFIDFEVRFEPEASENYDETQNAYKGRTDIKVLSRNWLRNRKDYYTIECKRLDETMTLKQKYVDEGICRFVGENPKYSSFNHRNIMFGFIVQNIDCDIIIQQIADIHNEKLSHLIIENITEIEKSENHRLCESKYNNQLSLSHIFCNVSCIINV